MNFDIKRVREQLYIDEGVERSIYLDHLGYPTFGVGHLITKTDPEYGEPVGTPISRERIDAAFDQDLETMISECYHLYGAGVFHHLPGEVQEILINMIFNLGRPRLAKFVKFNQAIYDQNWKEAAKEGRDSRWYNQVTNRAERLMSRLEEVE